MFRFSKSGDVVTTLEYVKDLRSNNRTMTIKSPSSGWVGVGGSWTVADSVLPSDFPVDQKGPCCEG